MARKANLCICLTSEEIESLEQKAKDLGLSKSATIGRLLIEPINNISNPLSNNTPVNHPGSCKELLGNFLKTLDENLLKDRQDIYDIIQGKIKVRPEAKEEE